ncbi:hypothetical protein [Bifidobacterium tibiigranuli]|uniref:Uncharacterized protein n=1 Tax=Bifidobacterium tibiigranuli TaxID=2172043 RepID=A0A5N6S2F1_9BIFI|nr:hypothetical protein [Bifidobacterium tibiigranuli]KAE8127294.1 hypothetical protein DDF78_08710 [Bifidobacterium tibiigranuli]KAE8129685.1 hypothetical protein DDE84_02490 [Bifidobacterium tibiigranuli]
MSRTTTTSPTIEEFDAWTDTAETEALHDISQRFHTRHIIKGDLFWALAPGGAIYKLPLALSINDFEALSNAQTDTESIEQIKRILSAFAGDKQSQQLEREPIQVVQNILDDYGRTITRSQGADLGKSAGSSIGSTNTAG